MDTILFAFLLTLFAGLSTSIGSTIAFLAKKTNTKFLSISLGFSAGVMIYVSFVELFPQARSSLELGYGSIGYVYAVLAFFFGILLIAVIDRIIPEKENPHNIHQDELEKAKYLRRMGLFTALAIALHNFPEGLATFVSALSDLKLGISIAIAIAIHNIPEGIAVSVPIYHATGSKMKAFVLSSLSGLAEPIGAIMGYFIFSYFLPQYLMGAIFAIVAGVMVYLSIDELLPTAREYGDHHLSIYGFIAGMVVMAFSLLLFI